MTNNINGIDVSEEIRYCNNCSNLGLDFKTGKFYCGLSNRKDELPEILSCENFSSSCYIKCLQEENERLNQELDIKEKMFDKFMIGSGETLEKLQKENEKLKADLKGETEQCQKWYQLETDKHFQMLKYEQALEKIRKEFINPSTEDGKAFVFQEGYIAALESVIGLIERFEE